MTRRRDQAGAPAENRDAQLAKEALIEALNRDCQCITVDEAALRRALEADLSKAGLPRPLFESHPHLFAESPVYLSRRHVARMKEIIREVEALVRTKPYLEKIREWTPPIAGIEPASRGVFFGYDFHLGPDGPQLIEINTNAGGALFNAFLARAQQACCPEVAQLLVGWAEPDSLEDTFLAMFRKEWSLQRPDQALARVAIVDDGPLDQAMYPEFILFQRLFERGGLEAVIADPSELRLAGGDLVLGERRIDLVYNRLCDFYLEAPAHAILKQAYQLDAALITPHPRAYGLYADKRNLTLLSDAEFLRECGLDEASVKRLTRGVPRALAVSEENADRLWSDRRKFFFKPVMGYGSRGAYRGDKLTRRVWSAIVSGGYIAQRLVRPSERHFVLDDGTVVLKVDLRAYTYAGEIQFLAARLYRGQTTNLRSPRGGFAPVYTESASF